jgi:hypothetical protein
MATLCDNAGAALLESLPRVLAVGLREYAIQQRHGDLAAAATNASGHLNVCHRGYDALAGLADIPGFCGSLMATLVTNQDFATGWESLIDACAKIPAVANLILKRARDGIQPTAIIDAEDIPRVAALTEHFFPRRRYTELLLRRSHATLGIFSNFKNFLLMAEASVQELSASPLTSFALHGRPEMEATLRAHPGAGGGIWVRLDSLTQPDLWGEFLITRDTIDALCNTTTR